jgi:hypothetical protein
MGETDPGQLHDELEGEADKLQQHSERLGSDVQDARQDWEQKRSDPSVPGAVPPSDEGEGEDGDEHGDGQDESPAPQAPPAEEGPSAAETAPEGAAGPPKDQLQDDEG